MNVLTWIIGTTCIISSMAFVGALTMFLKENLLDKILMVLVSFSAGTLIGGAFLHLIPETITRIGTDEASVLKAFEYLLLGFCVFFVLEQLIRWHHHHATSHPAIMPFSYLVLISDGLHNFIDGLVLAASFAVSLPMGTVTALAITLHEIPQEIGDFGVLVHGGFKRVKALIMNYVTATTIILGGIAGYMLHAWIGTSIVFLLAFAAGNFIYIAGTDLIPEIRYTESLKKSVLRFCVFAAGLGIMLAIRLFWFGH